MSDLARSQGEPGSQASREDPKELRPSGVDPSREAGISEAIGVPNECSDEAMEIVQLIEDKLSLAFAPNGNPHFTWRGGQDVGGIIDAALDTAFEQGFYAGIGRKPLPQGIEARSDETQSGSAEGESPVAAGDAP